ncbi:MAG TPA: NADH-quinone oxidoreductase subunit NuoG [Gammaproteobacteria bacterium]|nr:NADH-quinone oxidoreductase subunit NuoG [Gammaproteobacteria bacterium]
MADELVNIELDGKPVKARKGEMIIQAADREGVYIPRFCYHEKLSVAANCRMCLVEAEKSPKPLPACATPVMEGMKVFTRSVKAIAAQRATMEFLLINHPLDCPICDQGGECELQDLAMGYGRDISRYSEKKRVVKDEDIGPLVSTDMTRCIHCTRCVRFGQEIAGIQEMGGTGRGENLRIGTYIGKAVDHELSGNIIDLCPVGALNSKPFRNRGRGWEMTQVATVAPHDCVGSNLFGHVLRGLFMRAVPKPTEDINETWLSDRDRFSYAGVHSEERLLRPMVKKSGKWQETDWETALEAAVNGLKETSSVKGGDAAGVLASPSSTVEELYLLQKLARGLNIPHIDTRLRQADFRDDAADPVFPWLGQGIQDIEKLEAALVIGSNVRKEVPLLAHRLRKAALRGAAVMFLNPRKYPMLFPVKAEVVAAAQDMVDELAAVLKATAKPVPVHLKDVVSGQKPTAEHEQIAAELAKGESKTILLGHLALSHPHYYDLRALAAALAEATGAKLGYISEGANSAGAWLAGAVPHRAAGGRRLDAAGRNVMAMLLEPRSTYLLLNTEPELDCWDGAQALKALKSAKHVVAIIPYVTETMKQYANVLLPAGAYGETSGTYVNAEGRWQSFTGLTQPQGEARPAWKILRVMGNLCELKGFEQESSEDVLKEVKDAVGQVHPDNRYAGDRKVAASAAVKGFLRVGETPMYAVDALVRRAAPLQQTKDADVAYAQFSPEDAKRLKLEAGDAVSLKSNGTRVILPVKFDDSIAVGEVWVPGGLSATVALGPLSGVIEVEKA